MLCGGKTTVFYEVLQAPPTLAIFGAGHVGILLAKIAREVTPWKIVLHDDRKEREGLCPKGIEFRHLPSYQDVPRFSGQTYAVIATESHETDFQVAAALLGQDPGPAYLGMLGSRAKAAEIRTKLLSLGLPQEKVEALRCPVGLPLGGKDPGTVAISILSEILAFHHGARLP
jgi:xanthine dehydrogenase accessory factor